jgi:hypothetical protein
MSLFLTATALVTFGFVKTAYCSAAVTVAAGGFGSPSTTPSLQVKKVSQLQIGHHSGQIYADNQIYSVATAQGSMPNVLKTAAKAQVDFAQLAF